MKNTLSTCPGCKSSFLKTPELPAQRYGVASVECWAAFNRLLAYEADSYGYPEERELTTNAYFAQHPQNLELQKNLGIDERLIKASIQSVGRHLIGLYYALEKKSKLSDISSAMNRIISQGKPLEELQPPKSLGDITIADFSGEFSYEEYQNFALSWAQSVWDAWSDHHDLVRSWVDI